MSRRIGMSAVLVALAGVALGALAPAANAAPNVATIYHTEGLPVRNGDLRTVTLTCPPGYVATAGSTYPLPADVVLLKSASRGRTRVFLLSPAGYGPTSVTFVVTCVRTKTRRKVRIGGRTLTVSVPLRVRQVQGVKVVTIPPSASVKVTAPCPDGAAPVGSNAELRVAPGGDAPRDVVPAQVAIEPRFLETMPVRGGWDFGLANVGTVAAEARVSVNCLDRVSATRVRGRSVRTRFDVFREIASVTLPASGSAQRACSGGRVPLAPGFDGTLDGMSAAFHLLAAHPDERTAAIDVLAATGGRESARIRLAALCLRASRRVLRD